MMKTVSQNGAAKEKKTSDKNITIKGARVHNLKNISVTIPHNKFVVITGVSGSGKSSLAFDTLYAEGQRRYVESLSSYARQFMGRLDKPDVDYIYGISPAVAIEQKVNTRNPRSTVGTSTEIYDYLKLLFARTGITYSPLSGKEVKRDTVDSVVTELMELPDETVVTLYVPVFATDRSAEDELKTLMQKGFTRISIGGEIKKIEAVLSDEKVLLKSLNESLGNVGRKKSKKADAASVKNTTQSSEFFKIVIDRIFIHKNDEDTQSRIADSVQTAFNESHGDCIAGYEKNGRQVMQHFNHRFEADGMQFEEPSLHLFSFNNPYGACKTCEGFGSVIGIDADLVIPDKSKSVYDLAIVPWRGEKMQEYNNALIKHAYKFDFPIHRPYFELSESDKHLLWTGNQYFMGLNDFFKYLETQTYKIQYRVMLSRYRGRTICPDCRGSRLRKDAGYVKVGGKSITDIVLFPVDQAAEFFQNLNLSDHHQKIAKRILTEIKNRLQYLCDVGLGYLTLNRLSNSLSGGESQRINLATSLGSSLVGSMYILDEPSIGLHPRDTQRLITVLNALRNAGNTLIVVEHDEEVMMAADQIIDIGPEAGSHGGEIVAQGTLKEVQKENKSLTAQYLNGNKTIQVPTERRKWKNFIQVSGARENNLKNVTAKFPLNVLTCITGVSGSGKTSLVKKVLYPALKKIHGGFAEESGMYDKLDGQYQNLGAIEFVDQNPIGKSTRSNPVTYVKAWDDVRALFSDLPLSRARKYKPSHFSFNVEGGRCETCEGEGEVTIEMQFMAAIKLVCETCKGKRFKEEILEVNYKNVNVADLLDMTVDEAIGFFSSPIKSFAADEKIKNKLLPLQEVGLGYVKLGQSSSTLSGGEAQRIKLASFLQKGSTQRNTLFIFDEPTTGLHFHDIEKLLKSFNALINQGHSIITIEHNQEIIKCADWIIDLGPDGGQGGGEIIFEGTPEELVKNKKSYTGKFLKEKLQK